MARVLHLLKGGDIALALAAIERQAAAGDSVSVVVLQGAPAPTVPAGVRVLRVPDDAPYGVLLEEIFAADQVVTW